jgi:hypothetical protein
MDIHFVRMPLFVLAVFYVGLFLSIERAKATLLSEEAIAFMTCGNRLCADALGSACRIHRKRESQRDVIDCETSRSRLRC